ncbi:MAG: CHAT domain-containing protein [Cyanobacteria bacterium P01_F01_bin.150]
MPQQSHRIKPFKILGLFLISLALCLLMGKVRAIEHLSSRQLVQQGIDRYRAGDFRGAIAPWQAALDQYQTSDHQQNQSIVLENLARAYRNLGYADTSLTYWDQALSIHRQLGDSTKVGQLLTEKAQTYTRLGQYRQAVDRLCARVKENRVEGDGVERDEVNCGEGSAVAIARAVGDRAGEAAALGSLGDAQRLQGQADRAEVALMASLAIAQEIRQTTYEAAASHSLGQLAVQRSRVSDRLADDAQQRGDTADAEVQRQTALEQTQIALSYFEQSLALAKTNDNQGSQLQTWVSMVSAYHRAGRLSDAQKSYGEAIALLSQLPDSRITAYAAIDLANLLPLTRSLEVPRSVLSGATCGVTLITGLESTEAESLLKQGLGIAQHIGNYRAQSFASGRLGHLYECQGVYKKALSQTKQAEWAADQDLKSLDSLYLWQWQAGRIFTKQNQSQDAIDVYGQAIATLEKIRNDILIANQDIQFDFRDAVEPVYRELAKLRLDQTPTAQVITPDDQETSENINAALTAIDSLKLAELQNYFGDNCIILSSSEAEQANRALASQYDKTGIFSTFITDDRTAVVLTLPDGRQRIEWVPVNQQTLNQQVSTFRFRLEESLYSLEAYDPSLGNTLYDELIAPFITDLEEAAVETLVFVQDGPFRSIPMAALYDGQRYLIERYAIATTPSLALVDVSASPERRNLRALALGLSERATVDGQDFRPLEGVKLELKTIKAKLPRSQTFLNADFTRSRLQKALQEEDFSIIHLATHGKFGSEPEDTFLVTGDGEKLTIGELEAAIRQSGGTSQIDLLTLTACQTAIGDNRATLGLAGVAVQAGARSAIASLWSISDPSTAEIMAEFYQRLKNPDLPKAQALQAAQVYLLNQDTNFSRPGFWAPFVLIGDWR